MCEPLKPAFCKSQRNWLRLDRISVSLKIPTFCEAALKFGSLFQAPIQGCGGALGQKMRGAGMGPCVWRVLNRGFCGPKQQAKWFWIPFPASILELRSPLYHAEACGAEVDDFASWMHGFPGFMLLGVCYMQGGLGHSERGKAQEACFGLEVVRCDNYDIHPYLAFVHRCTSVLLSEQNNTKLTKRNSFSTKNMYSSGIFRKVLFRVLLILCVFFFNNTTSSLYQQNSPHIQSEPLHGNPPARCRSVKWLTP